MKKYDICVIGAGSAGLVAATTANRLGAKTALIENNKIGGECLHSGCVPSKTLIHAANVQNTINNAYSLGLPKFKADEQFDFNKVMGHVRDTIKSIYKHESKSTFEKMGIEVFFGSPEFLSNQKLKLNDNIITSTYFIICTGSSPAIPKVQGIDNIKYLTNDNFWDLEVLPKKILILGGGPIGIELGQAMSYFGSKVFIAIRSNRIIKNEDREIANSLEDILKSEGIKILKGTKFFKFEQNGPEIKTSYHQDDKEKKLNANEVLIAIGRKPNLSGLQLEKAGIRYNQNGIIVNDFLQANEDNIYACGDVIGKYLFTHAASFYANIAVNNIIKLQKTSISKSIMPWVIFTNPEIAHVGYTEEQAKEKIINYKVLHVNCNLDRFITENKTKGFIKILIDKNDKIIGAHIIGAHCGEYMQNITLAMQNNLSINDIANTIYPYPTMSEIVKKAFVRYLRTKE